MKKIKLEGFNNLTKTLSFNIYDICYTSSSADRREYIEYIDDAYNAERLTHILTDVCNIIDANILNIAHQDYQPQGASVTMLIAEELIRTPDVPNTESPGPLPDAVVGHLDSISTFRVDIDVSTCGQISPLKALNYLIHSFESDIVILDYRVRGFTRDIRGRKHFVDHKINSIQNFLSRDTRERYEMVDVNVYQENIFHTKMRLKNLSLDDYLFGAGLEAMTAAEKRRISRQVEHEIMEIFYGRNLPRR